MGSRRCAGVKPGHRAQRPGHFQDLKRPGRGSAGPIPHPLKREARQRGSDRLIVAICRRRPFWVPWWVILAGLCVGHVLRLDFAALLAHEPCVGPVGDPDTFWPPAGLRSTRPPAARSMSTPPGGFAPRCPLTTNPRPYLRPRLSRHPASAHATAAPRCCRGVVKSQHPSRNPSANAHGRRGTDGEAAPTHM
jgi:hypothetical protein